MIKFLIILISLICSISCTFDDDVNQDFELALIPILEVDLPKEFQKDSIYDLNIRYLRPTDCHFFRGFDYNYNDKERIVAILNTVSRNTSCKKLENDTISTTLKLRAEQNDRYIFKFWKGLNSEGANEFLIKEIPVVSK